MNNSGLGRRRFIQVASLSSVLVSSGMTSWALGQESSIATLAEHDLSALNNSIKASFGSGFEIVSHQFNDQHTMLEIEHLENRYWVSSSNLSDWQIVQAPVL